MQIRQQIVDAIDNVVSGKGNEPLPWSDDDTLMQTMGLDSLDLAVLVVTLEAELGVDPFRDGRAGVRTLGQLVEIYAAAVETQA